MKKTRITQSDVARAAGVHNTTVSLALRNCPALPEETRIRIQTIAKSMGYCPDPVLQALVAYRNGQAQRRPQQSIAYITNWTSKWGWRNDPAQFQYYLGAEQKATASGYQLEHFSLAETGMTPRRLSDMLYHRGIKGALIASQGLDRNALSEMEWSRLSAIKIGAFPRMPALCRVTTDDYGAARSAVRKVLEAGYQRIGLVLPKRWDDLADQAWSSAFLIEQALAKTATLLPILHRESWGSSAEQSETEFGASASLATFERWISIHQPDAIIGWSSQCIRDLQLLGLAVPADLAFVDLSLDNTTGLVAGVHQECEKVGEIAIDLLLNRMERNLCGIPQTSTTMLVESAWRNGASLPQKRLHPISDLRRRALHETLRGGLLSPVPQAV